MTIKGSAYRVFLVTAAPPKIHKYGDKLKYQNWCPPKNLSASW